MGSDSGIGEATEVNRKVITYRRLQKFVYRSSILPLSTNRVWVWCDRPLIKLEHCRAVGKFGTY